MWHASLMGQYYKNKQKCCQLTLVQATSEGQELFRFSQFNAFLSDPKAKGNCGTPASILIQNSLLKEYFFYIT